MGQVTFDKTIRRKKRVRAKINGTNERPRISVFRSSKYIYAQAIDDVARVTLAAHSSLLKKDDKNKKTKKADSAKLAGIALGKKLIEKKIKEAVFDRGGYLYKGRVKALAEGLREGGLKI